MTDAEKILAAVDRTVKHFSDRGEYHATQAKNERDGEKRLLSKNLQKDSLVLERAFMVFGAALRDELSKP